MKTTGLSAVVAVCGSITLTFGSTAQQGKGWPSMWGDGLCPPLGWLWKWQWLGPSALRFRYLPPQDNHILWWLLHLPNLARSSLGLCWSNLLSLSCQSLPFTPVFLGFSLFICTLPSASPHGWCSLALSNMNERILFKESPAFLYESYDN